MPVYNFKKEFADKVESGQKKQTIRMKRKRQTVCGDKLYLYTGMRTKNCRLLHNAICTRVESFVLWTDVAFSIDGVDFLSNVGTSGHKLAVEDGFKTWEDFVAFFKKQYGLPFYGEIISWEII